MRLLFRYYIICNYLNIKRTLRLQSDKVSVFSSLSNKTGSSISNTQDNPIMRNNFVYKTICSFIASFNSGDAAAGLIDLGSLEEQPFLYPFVPDDVWLLSDNCFPTNKK